MQNTIDTGSDGLRNILASAWRRRYAALLVGGCLFASLGSAMLLLTPRYTSFAMVLLPSAPTGDLGQKAPVLSATDPFLIRSEVEILNSDDLARRVIKDTGLEGREEMTRGGEGLLSRVFGGDPATWSSHEIVEDRVLRAYHQRLAVGNDGRSSTVSVGFTSEDPRLSADIVNAHVRTYLAMQVERRVSNQRKASAWLAGELEARATDLREAELAVQATRNDRGLISTRREAQSQSIAEQDLSRLSDQLTQARADAVGIRTRLAQTDDGRRESTEILQSPVYAKLRAQEADARTDLDRLNTMMKGSGDSQARSQTLRSIQVAMKSEMLRIRDAMRVDLDMANGRVTSLEREVEDAKRRKEASDRGEVDLSALVAAANAKRALYEAVQQRYNLLMAEQRFGVPEAQVVSGGAVPTRPSFPKPALMLALAFCVSALGGVGTAYAMDRSRTRTAGLDAISERLGLPVIEALPLPEKDRFGSDVLRSLFEERVRGIASTIIAKHQQQERGIVLVVSSTLPGEGRTLLASSLARTLSSRGLTTALIDADMRRPSVETRGAVNAPRLGIHDVAVEGVAVDNALVVFEPKGVSRVPVARQGTRIAVETLGGGDSRSVLDQLRSQFSVIVVDTPPAAAMPDAVTLAGLADATLYVVRDGYTPLDLAERTVDRFRQRGVEPTGIVVTATQDASGDDFVHPQVSRYFATYGATRGA